MCNLKSDYPSPQKTAHPVSCCIIFAIIFILCGCDQVSTLTDIYSSDPPTVLDDICESGELIILTRNAPTTYYEGRDGPDGFEYQLVERFAEELGVGVSYVVLNSVQDILSAIENGEGHIGAAGITRTRERKNRYNFGPDYKSVQQQLICHRKGQVPEKITHVSGLSLLVADGTSYVENLKRLKFKTPGLGWETTREFSTDQILEKVWRREIDCTIADSNIVAINRRYFPQLNIAFPVNETEFLAWVLPDNSENLQNLLQHWFEEIKANNVLAEIDDRFFGYIDIFDYVDIMTFKRRIRDRLPGYQQIFIQACKKENIPWTYLAAQSYQESHWNPKAKSPTGVRGIMMLTLPTAQSLGVTSRLDPEQNIYAGAKYMAHMIERIPDDVHDDDRYWFAMAAYNMGIGHLWDARTLARRLGKNPSSWLDIQEVLPLLSSKKYYKTLKYGYARGYEPVIYVKRIRNYQEILENELSKLMDS